MRETMDAEITSKDFEWIWKDRTRRIGHVYKMMMSGCVHVSIDNFIRVKESFLFVGHGLRAELMRKESIVGDRAMLFRLADGELEAAWEEIPDEVKRLG